MTSLGKNISALKIERQLSLTNSSLGSTFERLSSGLRITKPSDDAAGLAVATSLKADTRVYSQAIRNVNDGVSLLNIADSALENLSGILTRLQELASQASNGAYSNTQREALDSEAQALREEYFRISRATKFNGVNLFDGSLQGLSLQTGYSSILSSLGGSLGTGEFSQSGSYMEELTLSDLTSIEFADLNGDGILDSVGGSANAMTISLGNGDGTFGAATTIGASGTSIRLLDINNDGNMDIVGGGGNGIGSYIYISLGNGNGTFGTTVSHSMAGTGVQSLAGGDINGDGKIDLVSVSGNGTISIRHGNGDGTFAAYTSIAINNINIQEILLSDVNGDGNLDILSGGIGSGGGNPAVLNVSLGNGDGTFQFRQSFGSGLTTAVGEVELADLNNDGVLDAVFGARGGTDGYVSVLLGNANGSFGTATTYLMMTGGFGISVSSIAISDINGDGNLDVLATGATGALGVVSIRLGNGNGTLGASTTFSGPLSQSSNDIELEDLNGDGVPDLALSGTADLASSGTLEVLLADTRDGIHPLLPFSLATIADAKQAIGYLDKALDNLLQQRGEVGAFEARLSTALKHMSVKTLEYEAARSRIEDVDIASESAELVRKSILQDSASAVLAQANQNPSLVLKLLQVEEN